MKYTDDDIEMIGGLLRLAEHAPMYGSPGPEHPIVAAERFLEKAKNNKPLELNKAGYMYDWSDILKDRHAEQYIHFRKKWRTHIQHFADGGCTLDWIYYNGLADMANYIIKKKTEEDAA